MLEPRCIRGSGAKSAANFRTMNPLIGITTYGVSELGTDSRHYAEHYAVPAQYIDAVRRAGGSTVLLPPGGESIERWLGAVDALVVTGGSDVQAHRYGGDPSHPRIEAGDGPRDEMELALTDAVLGTDVPTLFVCRGMQVLNVACGGTLHPHVPDLGNGDIHRNDEGLWTEHLVEVEPGSALAKAMDATEASPISGHHQAVDRIGDGLRVVARAPDGVVEALEYTDHPWAIGVQWHPEVTAATDPTQQSIFNALVRAV